MNVTMTDFKIITAMLGAIVIMTLALGAFGLTSQEVQASDFPELDIDTDRFSFALNYPSEPETNTEGTLIYESENPTNTRDYSSSPSSHQQWVYRETDSSGSTTVGTSIAWLPESMNSDFNETTMQVSIAEFSGGSVTTDRYTLAEGESVEHENDSTWIYLEHTNLEFDNETFRSELEFEVIEHGEIGDESFTVTSIVDGIAQFVLLVGWLATFLFEIATNLIFMLFSVVSYVSTLIYFTLETYLVIATSVPGVWQPFTLIPGVILFLEIGKVTLVAISLLPTT